MEGGDLGVVPLVVGEIEMVRQCLLLPRKPVEIQHKYKRFTKKEDANIPTYRMINSYIDTMANDSPIVPTTDIASLVLIGMISSIRP